MTKLLCFLTGGHRYNPAKLSVQPSPNGEYMTFANECTKCGAFWFDKISLAALYANVEHCVSCGAVIPEGRQVCPNCEKGADNAESR